MRSPIFPSALLALCLFTSRASADLTVHSGPARVHLIELYTSEGCSSCPPAERWLSALQHDPRLWKAVVPVAFHVDYWDNLGWKDLLSSPAYTTRQRNYATAWGSSTVYTPGFVLDGREWREQDLAAVPAGSQNAGLLTATLRDNGDLQVVFEPAGSASGRWQANAALIGFGISSRVQAGENRGRNLLHDFAVLDQQSGAMVGNGQTARATLHLPVRKVTREQAGLAVWISSGGENAPVQAAGGTL